MYDETDDINSNRRLGLFASLVLARYEPAVHQQLSERIGGRSLISELLHQDILEILNNTSEMSELADILLGGLAVAINQNAEQDVFSEFVASVILALQNDEHSSLEIEELLDDFINTV